MGGADHHTSEGEQADGVRNDHEVVEHIGHLPHQVVGHQGAQENEHQADGGIDLGRLLAEEIDYIDLAEQVPAEDGGEGKEEPAAGEEPAL